MAIFEQSSLSEPDHQIVLVTVPDFVPRHAETRVRLQDELRDIRTEMHKLAVREREVIGALIVNTQVLREQRIDTTPLEQGCPSIHELIHYYERSPKKGEHPGF